ncbi:MAG: GLUG motif-containing protein [Phycisphaerae bacterium]
MLRTIMPAFFLSVLLLPNPAWAKYSGGSGEPNDPYQITAAADLLTLAADTNDYGKNFVLTADINLAACTFTTAVIAPDGDNSNWVFDGTAFTGVFDGAGHKILNLTIDTNGVGNEYLGLFGFVTGEIKNLTMENVEIISGIESYCLGGLAGQNDGNISNCSSTTAVTGGIESSCLGGLVGQNGGNISNCFSTAAVIGGSGSSYLGCLTGWSYSGTISNCCSTGSVTGEYLSQYLGGLAGWNDDVISNCCSTANITGGDYASNLGGLAGWNYLGTISNCYSTGLVSSPGFFLGGLIGQSAGGSISSCYFLDDSGPDNGLGEPLTDEQMKQQSSFIGWDFVGESANGSEDFWAICETVTYPKLTCQFTVGDYDNDKDVDFVDFAPMALKWLQADSNLYCGGADLTGDGWVDINDLEILTGNWLH